MHNLRSPGGTSTSSSGGESLGDELAGVAAKSESAKMGNGDAFFAYYGGGHTDSERMLVATGGGSERTMQGEDQCVEVVLLEPLKLDFEHIFGRIVLKSFEEGEWVQDYLGPLLLLLLLLLLPLMLWFQKMSMMMVLKGQYHHLMIECWWCYD